MSSDPVITSLLDTDYYKLTMQQGIFHHYPTAVVDARFHCRTPVDLTPLADDIREQIQHLEGLRLSSEEYTWLLASGVFKQDYLDWLSTHRLDAGNVDVQVSPEGLTIQVQGTWGCDSVRDLHPVYCE